MNTIIPVTVPKTELAVPAAFENSVMVCTSALGTIKPMKKKIKNVGINTTNKLIVNIITRKIINTPLVKELIKPNNKSDLV